MLSPQERYLQLLKKSLLDELYIENEARLAAHDITGRTVWVADSFAGVPAPQAAEDRGYDLSASVYPILAIPRDDVEELFRRYDLLDGRVQFLEGWFKDTLPVAPIEHLA